MYAPGRPPDDKMLPTPKHSKEVIFSGFPLKFIVFVNRISRGFTIPFLIGIYKCSNRTYTLFHLLEKNL